MKKNLKIYFSEYFYGRRVDIGLSTLESWITVSRDASTFK